MAWRFNPFTGTLDITGLSVSAVEAIALEKAIATTQAMVVTDRNVLGNKNFYYDITADKWVEASPQLVFDDDGHVVLDFDQPEPQGPLDPLQIKPVDFIHSGEPATIPLGFIAACTVAEQVGDPVVFSTTVANQVERLTSNSFDTRLVVGIISTKLTATSCFVVTVGVLQGISSGLSQGQPVWVSPTGGLTTTKPTSGHLQVLGSAVSATDVSVSPEERKTILS